MVSSPLTPMRKQLAGMNACATMTAGKKRPPPLPTLSSPAPFQGFVASFRKRFKENNPVAPSTPTTEVSRCPASSSSFGLYGSGKELAGKYVLSNEIGSGRHGVVYSCQCKQSGRKLAVKAISKLSPASRLSASREKAVHARLSSAAEPPIIRVHEVLEDDHNVYLVQDLAGGGDLWGMLRQIGKCTEEMAQGVFRQAMEAVHFCHVRGVAHSDLKLENFVLMNLNSLNEIKLLDFGTAMLTDRLPGHSLGSLGSIEYMAPERETGELDVSSREQCLAGDLYSSGIVLFLLLFGRYPDKRDISAGVEAEWAELSPEARALLEELTQEEPTFRPTAEQVLRGAWLAKPQL